MSRGVPAVLYPCTVKKFKIQIKKKVKKGIENHGNYETPSPYQNREEGKKGKRGKEKRNKIDFDPGAMII